MMSPGLPGLQVASDALLALAYVSLLVVAVRFAGRRSGVQVQALAWIAATCLAAGALRHGLTLVSRGEPFGSIEAGLKAIAAVAALAATIVLWPLVPRALGQRASGDLERLNEQLRVTVDESEKLLRRYEREHYIATTLQNASLGELPPRLGSLEISAGYRPGVGDLEIGGDWYDAFQLPDGRVIVSIGDVAGKGLGASVIMSKMRQAIRVAAQVQVTPNAILDAADKSLRLEYPQEIVTAFVGIVDDTEGILSYATAGHPAPLLRSPSGSIVELQAHGLPLGLRSRDDADGLETRALVSGSMLVLFTDGLVESTHNYAEGERRLADALAHHAVALAPNPAREILEAVLFDGVRDDVAVLTIRVGNVEWAGERWIFDIRDANAAHNARAAMVGILGSNGADREELFAAELIYGELIGNIARHAVGLVDVRLDWHTGAPVLHVLDNGPGFQYVPGLPTDILAESGRGLFIVHRMTPEFTIIRRPQGGSHARAVLPLARPVAIAR